MTAAEKFDKIPPWCVVHKTDGGFTVKYPAAPMTYADSSGCWNLGSWFDTESEARRIARLTRPLDSWEPAPDCALPVEGWYIKAHTATSVGLYDANGMHPTGADRLFPTRRAAIVWAWTEAPAPEETKKPITEADVKVGQVWVCGLPTCEHRRRVDGISGGRVRTTWLSPREGCDSVAMAEFVSYLNRDPASHLITPGPVATDGLEARVGKVEGVLARIGSMESFIADAQALADRMTIVERLVAAQVPVPAKVNVRSDAASTNEAMTEAAASDEGWREMLVAAQIGPQATLYTPDLGFIYNQHTSTWRASSYHKDNKPRCKHTKETTAWARTCPPPPNLAEWWKPGADTAYHGNLADIADAVPSTYRVGDDLAAWVRDLAAAHDLGVKAQAELRQRITELERSEGDLAVDNAGWMRDAENLRTQLAAAQAATVAAEGRAETAKKRATEAESKLAELRAQLEAALT